jgi:hypothetical protein
MIEHMNIERIAILTWHVASSILGHNNGQSTVWCCTFTCTPQYGMHRKVLVRPSQLTHHIKIKIHHHALLLVVAVYIHTDVPIFLHGNRNIQRRDSISTQWFSAYYFLRQATGRCFFWWQHGPATSDMAVKCGNSYRGGDECGVRRQEQLLIMLPLELSHWHPAVVRVVPIWEPWGKCKRQMANYGVLPVPSLPKLFLALAYDLDDEWGPAFDRSMLWVIVLLRLQPYPLQFDNL